MMPTDEWNLKTVTLPASRASSIYKAVVKIKQGKSVAFPTDTVYGLGAAASDEAAIEQLYRVKGRESTKAIPVLIGTDEDLATVATDLNPAIQRLVKKFWPGPLTLVLPRNPLLPTSLAPIPTVGVRMPDHPVALDLLCRTGPLAVTSANLSAQPNTTTAEEVFAQLAGRVELILDGGRTPGGRPSTVVDCTTPELKIIRAGPITLEELISTIHD